MKNLIFWIVFLLGINTLLLSCSKDSDSPTPSPSPTDTTHVANNPNQTSHLNTSLTQAPIPKVDLRLSTCSGLKSIKHCIDNFINYRGGDQEAELKKCYEHTPNETIAKRDALALLNYFKHLDFLHSRLSVIGEPGPEAPKLPPEMVNTAFTNGLLQRRKCMEQRGVRIGDEPQGLGQISSTSTCRQDYLNNLLLALSCSNS